MSKLLNTFASLSQFHIAEKLSLSEPKNIHKCQLGHQVFDVTSSLRLHGQKMHNAQELTGFKNADMTQLVGPIDDES